MSTPNPTPFTSWWTSLPVPWLVAGPNGQNYAAAMGAVFDGYVNQLLAARKVAYPDYAPVDALSHLGADRALIQGPNESNSSFTVRLKDVWAQWSRAGTACGVLEQLAYFTQSTNATWLQQNGLRASLTSMPTPGQDPTSLIAVSNAPATGGILSSSSSPYRQIPAGTSWYFLDGNTDLCNRFAIRFSSWPFAALTTAYFVATDNVAVTWPFTFASTSYSIQIGTPVVTDGSCGVVLHADGATQTTTGVTIRASAPFTGYASVVAYATGVSPFNTFSSASAGQLRSIISAFRPNAICTGVYAIGSGRVLGDGHTLGDGGLLGGNVIKILGSF